MVAGLFLGVSLLVVRFEAVMKRIAHGGFTGDGGGVMRCALVLLLPGVNF